MAKSVCWREGTPRLIVVGTGNRNKLAELRAVAGRYAIALLSPQEAREQLNLGPWPEVSEDDPTYRGNALLKARAFAVWSGCPSLGDDSGLEVAALGGRPGVYSARYAGPGATDRDRIEKLLGELHGLDAAAGSKVDRSAQFRCVLTLVDNAGEVFDAEGTLEGEILEVSAGNGGFGYDPIVRITELEATLAEVDFSLTCERGFRARAATALFCRI